MSVIVVIGGVDSGRISRQISLMESLDAKVSEDATQALRNSLADGTSIGALVEYYTRTQSIRALELLCQVQEPNDTTLLDNVSECMSKNPQGTMILLGRIVQLAPSWLPKVAQHHIFRTLLAFIRSDNGTEIETVTSSLLFTVSILPYCSALNEQIYDDLFVSFMGAVSLYGQQCHCRKDRSTAQDLDNGEDLLTTMYTEALWLELTKFFRTFYTLFPCNLLASLREHLDVSSEVTRPVLEQLFTTVRLHPGLLQRSEELGRQRWTNFETHDFFAFAQSLAAAPLDGDGLLLSPFLANDGEDSDDFHEDDRLLATTSFDSRYLTPTALTLRRLQTSERATPPSEVCWSPSVGIGLETPPEMSPAIEESNTVDRPFNNPSNSDEQRRKGIAANKLKQSKIARSASSAVDRLSQLFWRRSTEATTRPTTVQQTTSTSSLPNMPKLQNPFEVAGVAVEEPLLEERERVDSIQSAEECISEGNETGTKVESEQLPKVQRKPTTPFRKRSASVDDRQHNPGHSQQYSDVKIHREGRLFRTTHPRRETITGDFHGSGEVNVGPSEKDTVASESGDITRATLRYLLSKAADTRQRYISLSAEHHERLKEVGLADRIPGGKMYTDLRQLISELATDKQRDILCTRLRLVNQHLLFERYSRLLYATRNRRLFARLKQRAGELAEFERLKKTEHYQRSELEEQREAMAELRTDLHCLKQSLQETESRHLIEHQAILKEKLALEGAYSELEQRYELLQKASKSVKNKLDIALRRQDDLLTERRLLEQRLTQMGQLQRELTRCQKEKQKAEEQMKKLEASLKQKSLYGQDSGPQFPMAICDNQNITATAPNYELNLLRAQYRKAKTHGKQALERAKEMENQWHEELEKRMELQSNLERASILHSTQLEAAQHKYNSILAICTKQEAQIFNLYRAFENQQPVLPTSTVSTTNLPTSSATISMFPAASSQSTSAESIPIPTTVTFSPSGLVSCDSSYAFSEMMCSTLRDLFTNPNESRVAIGVDPPSLEEQPLSHCQQQLTQQRSGTSSPFPPNDPEI